MGEGGFEGSLMVALLLPTNALKEVRGKRLWVPMGRGRGAQRADLR